MFVKSLLDRRIHSAGLLAASPDIRAGNWRDGFPRVYHALDALLTSGEGQEKTGGWGGATKVDGIGVGCTIVTALLDRKRGQVYSLHWSCRVLAWSTVCCGVHDMNSLPLRTEWVHHSIRLDQCWVVPYSAVVCATELGTLSRNDAHGFTSILVQPSRLSSVSLTPSPSLDPPVLRGARG